MPKKKKVEYVCTECGGTSIKWAGKCPHCGAWNTLKEFVVEQSAGERISSASSRAVIAPTEILDLGDVRAQEVPRTLTGMSEFDRVLGGGLVSGGVALLGGDPGIGKSTLLLQVMQKLSASGLSALYVSGEESPGQIALRARRLELPASGLHIMSEIALEKIEAAIEGNKPDFVVIDSIQTLYTEALDSAPGSVTQVKECSARLTRLAKALGTRLIFVGHVTKDGTLAGPRVLEHIVDTVLYFEGDTHSNFRIIRAFKNRFGAVNEIGVFAMTDKGLRSVVNPSAIFLSEHRAHVPGSVIMATQEGNRPLLVEIQALVDETKAPNARRLCVGLDIQRLAMLLAVLHRHAGIPTYEHDVFVNAVGGVKITEPASDLAVLMAVASSLRNRPVPQGAFAFGEIGLSGEVRPAPRGQERLKEAQKLGFSLAIVPKSNMPRSKIEGLDVIGVSRLSEALEIF